MNTLMIPVKFAMKHGARLPLKHTSGSCGRDLLTLHEVILQPGELRIIDTGKLRILSNLFYSQMSTYLGRNPLGTPNRISGRNRSSIWDDNATN